MTCYGREKKLNSLTKKRRQNRIKWAQFWNRRTWRVLILKSCLKEPIRFKKIWQRSYLTSNRRKRNNNNKEKLQRENRKKEAKRNTAALKAEARVPLLAIIYPNIYVAIMIKILQSIFTEIQPGIILKFRLHWTLQTYSTVWKNYRRKIFWMATHHESWSAK